MQPAPHPLLYHLLGDYLRARGATIRHAPLDGDAHWHGPTQTLTLRADADTATHFDIVRDFIAIADLGDTSRLGAQSRPHLQAVS